MIDQKAAEDAVDWLVKNVAKMAQDRANRVYMEQWIKTVKAQLQTEQAGASAAASEILAMSSPKYLAALEAYKQAVQADEYNRFAMTAAEARISFWRSSEATRRIEERATS